MPDIVFNSPSYGGETVTVGSVHPTNVGIAVNASGGWTDLSPEDTIALATHILYTYRHNMDPDVQRSFGQMLIEDANARDLPASITTAPKATARLPQRRFLSLSPQAQLVYKHMKKAGSISAREAMNDHGITSASLARRICDIEQEGWKVNRDRKKHPLTGKDYTRYSLAA